MTLKKTESAKANSSSGSMQRVVRRRWFAQLCLDAEDGWAGPFKTIDEALDATLKDEEWWDYHSHPVYVTTGRKLRKAEIEGMGVDYEWEVATNEAWAIKRAKPSNHEMSFSSCATP